MEQKVEETKTVMSENINLLKEREEKLDSIRMSTDGMKETSSKMNESLEKLRKANERNNFW